MRGVINYRPISLLPVEQKLKRIVQTVSVRPLTANNLISAKHGLRKENFPYLLARLL